MSKHVLYQYYLLILEHNNYKHNGDIKSIIGKSFGMYLRLVFDSYQDER